MAPHRAWKEIRKKGAVHMKKRMVAAFCIRNGASAHYLDIENQQMANHEKEVSYMKRSIQFIIVILLCSILLSGYVDIKIVDNSSENTNITTQPTQWVYEPDQWLPSFRETDDFLEYIRENNTEGMYVLPTEIHGLGEFEFVVLTNRIWGEQWKKLGGPEYRASSYTFLYCGQEIDLSICYNEVGQEQWDDKKTNWPSAEGINLSDMRFIQDERVAHYFLNDKICYFYQNGQLQNISWFYGERYYALYLTDAQLEEFTPDKGDFIAQLLNAETAEAATEAFSKDHGTAWFMTRREKCLLACTVAAIALLMAGGAAGVIVYKKRKKAKYG